MRVGYWAQLSGPLTHSSLAMIIKLWILNLINANKDPFSNQGEGNDDDDEDVDD